MPIYEYTCEACQANMEVMQKISDPAPTSCEKCGNGPVKRQMSRSTSFALRGSGWYVTDFKGDSNKSKPSDGSGSKE